MIGILLVVPPRIVTDDGVHPKQPEEKDEAEPELERRNGVQHVIAVIKVVDLLEPETTGHGKIVALVGEHAFADASGAGMIVIRGTDQVSGVPLAYQFQHQSSGEDRQVI